MPLIRINFQYNPADFVGNNRREELEHFLGLSALSGASLVKGLSATLHLRRACKIFHIHEYTLVHTYTFI